MIETIANVALAYAKRGWKPVPVSRMSKTPIGKDWQTQPFNPAQFNGNVQNIGIQLGEASKGLTDVDLDSMIAIGLAPEFLPSTTAIFGRRSKPCSHQLYVTDLAQTEKRAVLKYTDMAKASIVELRIGGNSKGAMSVFPPSMHSAGETVQWVSDGEPARVDGDGLKRSVLRLAVACLLKPAYPGAGSRHEGALVLGGVLARAGWNANDIEHLVEVLARSCGDDDVRDRVVAATSALDAKINGRDIAGMPRLAEVWGQDVANILAKWLNVRKLKDGAAAGLEDETALQFAAQHGDDYGYVAQTGHWMRWQGTRWLAERTLAAFDAARTLCRQAGDADAKVVSAVERLARSDRRIAATVEQWDADPDILCTPEGIIDLKTGETRPPLRTDYCTKQTTIAPAPPGTPCDLWLNFLDRVTKKDDELIGFLQRYVGYCLTGHVHEHVFIFLYGTGANGKGTFIKIISSILNDYCVTSPIEMFLRSKYDRHPTELARLHKVRLTVAQETPKGRGWDEAKIKNLTGGDVITGRFMRGDFFDFPPTHKLIIAGNHKPSLYSVDVAMRRRLGLIPFTVTIPEPERDRNLGEKLKADRPAILRWMIDGCLVWRRTGLVIPDVVREATDDYFVEQDDIAKWLEDCTEHKPRAFTSSNALFRSWQRWCGEHGVVPGKQTGLTEALQDRGFIYKPTKNARGFLHLALKGGGETQM